MKTSPFSTSAPSTTFMMASVLFALMPAVIVYTYYAGWSILIMLLLASVSALCAETLVLVLRGWPIKPALFDLSAIVTAWLLALSLPTLVPWWLTVTAVFIAIIIGKQIYGGLGQNVFNPAMLGFAAVLIAFPALMVRWPNLVNPSSTDFKLIFGGSATDIDAHIGATPLASMRAWLSDSDNRLTDLWPSEQIYGYVAGVGWEWIACAYLLGGLALIFAKIIPWRLPVSYLLTVLCLSSVLWWYNDARFASPLFHLMSGGVLMAAFFIITDPISGSITPRGQVYFAIGAGLLTYVIRVFGAYPDGIAFAVLLMNCAVPLIDRLTRPRVFGER